MPDDGAGADEFSVVMAVEHGTAGQHDRRDVDGRRRHQAGRSRLVAAGGQHHPVERIAVKHFDEPEKGEIAVERGGRTLAGFLQRVDRKFHRNAAGLADAVFDAGGELQVMAVARHQVAACLGDADDRLARLQLGTRQAVVEKALQIKRGHPRLGRIVEPQLAA